MNEIGSVEHHDEDGCHGKVRLHGRVRLDIMVNLYQGYVTMVKMDKRTWGMFKKKFCPLSSLYPCIISVDGVCHAILSC